MARSIKDNGYFFQENFLSKDAAKNIFLKAKSILDSIDLSKTQEHKHFIVANHLKSKEVKGTLHEKNKPVIVTRGLNKFDIGFVEIFNADRLIKEIPTDLINECIRGVVSNFGISNPSIKYSIYWSDNVEQVRGYHRDIPLSGSKFLQKLFIYLTDVPDISYGPHSYIPKTHIGSHCARFANQLVGNYSDPSEYDCSIDPKIFLGPPGTMVQTTQSGLHRGLPQQKGKERMVLACKIRR